MLPKLIAANWKMHGTLKEARHLLMQLADGMEMVPEASEVVVCPPFTLLSLARQALEGSSIELGAQNCYIGREGAFTGEISPAMLVDIGCEYVILGHSERRQYFGETDGLVSTKLRSALDHALKPIVCIGETDAERERDQTEDILLHQVQGSLAAIDASDAANVTIAYEPVWAIGTSKTATPDQAQEAHAFIRGELRKRFGSLADDMRILYGGSMKPENATSLFAEHDVDGGLVGGASLDASSFLAILAAAV